jgi:cell division protein FtsB
MVETMVKELRERQRLRRFLYSWLSLGVLAVITFFVVKGAFGIIQIERKSAERVRELEREATELTLREEKLKDEIEYLKTPDGVVDAIKDKFSVTREGEYVAIIVDERSRASSSEEEEAGWLAGLWQGVKSLWEKKP